LGKSPFSQRAITGLDAVTSTIEFLAIHTIAFWYRRKRLCGHELEVRFSLEKQNILIIGGGIGGLTSAIALGKDGHRLTIAEKDPDWAVYGVGIIQQGNVVRAMKQLGIIDDYLDSGFGFNFVEVCIPTGEMVARIPSHPLVEGYPANMGVSRPGLHKVLGDRAIAAGAEVRLGLTVNRLDDDGTQVTAHFSDGTSDSYDLVIGADGLYSRTREQIFPESPKPEFTGQSVWRYNFAKPADLDCLRAYDGQIGIGLVPLSETLMYMYVTTPEPDNPWYETNGLAAAMQGKLAGAPPAIAALAADITVDKEVVYKPLETIMIAGDWHKGRVVLLGDAVHATTPHLGQGAGMAIEDSIVLAEEIANADTPEAAFAAFRNRRFERCKYIVDASLAICNGQLGKSPRVDQADATRAMFVETAKPI
jgi:2-polyprenyl-6-methoxyphenol hydroxylase-like FAD-dependent oxidoreductase